MELFFGKCHYFSPFASAGPNQPGHASDVGLENDAGKSTPLTLLSPQKRIDITPNTHERGGKRGSLDPNPVCHQRKGRRSKAGIIVLVAIVFIVFCLAFVATLEFEMRQIR